MPEYHFTCEACSNDIEFSQSITQPLPAKCPKCKAKEPDFHQVYQETQPLVTIKEIKTVGQQAEANQKRWGKELTQIKGEEIRNRYKDAKSKVTGHNGKPMGRKPIAPKKTLDLNKITNVKRYIEEGKK